MLLYVVRTAGEFVWNDGSVVQLPAPYITLCDFFKGGAKILIWRLQQYNICDLGVL